MANKGIIGRCTTLGTSRSLLGEPVVVWPSIVAGPQVLRAVLGLCVEGMMEGLGRCKETERKIQLVRGDILKSMKAASAPDVEMDGAAPPEMGIEDDVRLFQRDFRFVK